MAATITVKIYNGIYLQAGEEAIVRRIAQVVIGIDEFVYQKKEGYKWELGANSWLADGLSTETKWGDNGSPYREIVVAYRYGSTNDHFMHSLETVLNFIFQ